MADAYTFGENLTDSMGMVRFLGYVVEVGGVRAYHAGDCIPYPGQAERLRALRPVLALIPMHWELFAHNRGFPDQLVGFVAANFPELSVLVMGRGTTFTCVPESAR